MAKRLSVKEILEAARKGGPAKPADEGAPAAEEAAAPEAEIEAAPEAAPEPVAAAAAANVPTPSTLGRPLTLKEKLAAARAGGAPAPAAAPKAAAAAPKAKAAVEDAGAQAAEEAASEEAPKAVPAPAKPLGRPMTLQEKLAAARGGGATAPAPAGGAKPAAAKAPAAAGAPKAAAARVLPPLEKMSDPRDLAEAARQASAKKAKEIAALAAAKAPPKPAKAPAKPQTVPPRPTRELAEAGAAGATAPTRRNFLTSTVVWIIAGWITFTAAISAMTLMTVRFMFPNVLAEPPSTIKIGLPSRYEAEEVSERFKTEWGFWVVRTSRYKGQDIIYALQSVCTHLGCPPNWLAAEQKFKCPCHGSGFYITGVNFEGPAPRPLERFKVALADDGQIMVDKSQTYKNEVGQWEDPDSFIPV